MSKLDPRSCLVRGFYKGLFDFPRDFDQILPTCWLAKWGRAFATIRS